MSTAEVLLIVAIPFVAGLLGWITNVVALHMTFYPLEYVGCVQPWLGWQGIVPRRAAKMAATAIRLVTHELLSVPELLDGLDPEEMTVGMEPGIRAETELIVSRVAEKHAPTLWALTGPGVKAEIEDAVFAEGLPLVEETLADVLDDIESYLDMETMVVDLLTSNKALLNELFLEVGAEEFTFIRRSGFVLGFGFGLVQMALWIWIRGWWILPLAGFAVGYATNWIALKVIFRPLHPRPLCGGRYICQGLFLKRQEEVAAAYAAMVADKILCPENIFEELALGPRSSRVYALLVAKIDTAVDAALGPTMLSAVLLYLGASTYARLKKQIAHRLFVRLPNLLAPVVDLAHESLDLESRLRAELVALDPAGFEAMLHPIFEEDEITLIVVGAVLGGIVGGLQAAVQVAVVG